MEFLKGRLEEFINNRSNMAIITIIEYRREHQPYFENLNRDWLEKFGVEEVDLFVLQKPEEAILSKGGAILMALYDDAVVGTVALRKISTTVFEFTKMTVDKNYRRRGIAEKLSYAALEKARQLGAKKVILYSQSVLVPALTMYKKLGFKEVAIGERIYKRADVKMEIELHVHSKLTMDHGL